MMELLGFSSDVNVSVQLDERCHMVHQRTCAGHIVEEMPIVLEGEEVKGTVEIVCGSDSSYRHVKLELIGVIEFLAGEESPYVTCTVAQIFFFASHLPLASNS
eukprot:TRINITY_DN2017_c0_g1_i10.p1 TRINITY_DN2017_c0_g1~~TRINITY_DN2017_c0_g1_i10.p1  ORF type:complete len:103 (-),score=3.74 TRINITY_DN2017_c0_g1_i10:586-894(-)